MAKEDTGGTVYGANTRADSDGSRKPGKNERFIARFQAKHLAWLALKLAD